MPRGTGWRAVVRGRATGQPRDPWLAAVWNDCYVTLGDEESVTVTTRTGHSRQDGSSVSQRRKTQPTKLSAKSRSGTTMRGNVRNAVSSAASASDSPNASTVPSVCSYVANRQPINPLDGAPSIRAFIVVFLPADVIEFDVLSS